MSLYVKVASSQPRLEKERIMPKVTSLEFQRNFGALQHQAHLEPVEIMRHGQRAFILLSVDHYDWLRAAARRNHRTENAAPVVVDAVERAEMEPFGSDS